MTPRAVEYITCLPQLCDDCDIYNAAGEGLPCAKAREATERADRVYAQLIDAASGASSTPPTDRSQEMLVEWLMGSGVWVRRGEMVAQCTDLRQRVRPIYASVRGYLEHTVKDSVWRSPGDRVGLIRPPEQGYVLVLKVPTPLADVRSYLGTDVEESKPSTPPIPAVPDYVSLYNRLLELTGQEEPEASQEGQG